MPWNWELSDWPRFRYEVQPILDLEREFFLKAGSLSAHLKTMAREDYHHYTVEILSLEGMQSSKIEGELLDRESLQSSIKKHLGLHTGLKRDGNKEARMAALLCNMYETFDRPVSHEMLWEWHRLLFEHSTHIDDCGRYRSFEEPMQIIPKVIQKLDMGLRQNCRQIDDREAGSIENTTRFPIVDFRRFHAAPCQLLSHFRYISNRYEAREIFFEAPPSRKMDQEMSAFIDWLNHCPSASILGKAAVAHVYFESIHPFEDGNGRIGRALVEKMLSQSVGRSALIAVSRELEKRRKEYYTELGKCNRTLEIQDWVEFFVQVVLKAQEESMRLLYFLIEKSKWMGMLSGQINPRQEKVLLRMFAEGPDGFQGGLSAEKYIAITKATRATATRDLTDLLDLGVLIKTGELRYTRYWLNLYRK